MFINTTIIYKICLKNQSNLNNSAMPPGLSLMVQENLTSLPSAAKPRSKHRPRIVVSILPPQSGITTLEKIF